VRWYSSWQTLTTKHGTTCARVPSSNTPVTAVTSNDIRCNARPAAASGKCSVNAGGTVTVEMHQVGYHTASSKERR